MANDLDYYADGLGSTTAAAYLVFYLVTPHRMKTANQQAALMPSKNLSTWPFGSGIKL